VALPKTTEQLRVSLAGLIVPAALRAWLRDLGAALTPSYAGLEKSTPFTVNNVGQTAVVISFAGGNAYARDDGRYLVNVPTGQITRVGAGSNQFGAQVTVEVPTTTDVEILLFKNGVSTIYRTEIQTDNKALVSTFVMTGITADVVSAVFDLRIRRVAGTSNLVVQYATFYMATL